ncbi:chemotaxis-specific protein-glutamate methyltransferase CheB [Roseicyclus sp. F158]|uniref:Protein-glutamate methylesterase/protein-glutamine glutaminase n=1 Tax=Tropicimonas omnivorans TaxID=3075590 RepID=A0ABU3DJP2_9RHOB|nr:chemotaxis-specific protein-glutamate methyltransferase CheB [Roseicyclus sp. F158]MDT0683934.1 chemotaxis-specific protein-glutamate methyltransferase CheB [Roseicyclus sp. F158]
MPPLPAEPPVRVVIVEDSVAMRRILRLELERDGRFDVVGEAGDPYEARAVIRNTSPDVLTLDIEMPRMDGISFLRKLMSLRPMPVVMLSSLTVPGSRAAVEALSLGAVDCIDKASITHDIGRARLPSRIHAAASAQLHALPRANQPLLGRGRGWDGRAILIGASTGGVRAIERLLAPLPADAPPIAIVQHMPKPFLENFAQRLGALSAVRVSLAHPGAELRPGHVWIAPGGAHHLVVAGQSGGVLTLDLQSGGKRSGHRPSVDALFTSAEPYGPYVVATLLTGMGKDGAEGMARLRRAGAHTIAQSASTCVVAGMPGAAMALGAAIEEIPLDRIPRRLMDLTGNCAAAGPAQRRRSLT